DYPGAIDAAKMAVSAGYPGLEQTEFTRMVLAHLYECTGKQDSAEYQYRVALKERPDYAFAIAGLGKLEKGKGNYKEAIEQYEKAKNLIVEYSFSDELTDLYKLNNEKAKADQSAKDVIAMLGPGSGEDESVSGHGHYADKELAFAYLKVNDTENALKHALKEFNRRPANIDVCETTAWVYYKMNDAVTANKLITIAMRTNSQNPYLLCRAGLIKIKNGEKAKGIALIQKAFQLNPFMTDIELKNEASAYLTAI
ncbi:MAG: transposase, partial [Bacteroidota bacterium]|nr:transposase [Bacteroidota bacterium]